MTAIEWIRFDVPAHGDREEESWMVNLNFMFSTWECLFGRGCPGFVGTQQSTYASDTGCCQKGAWFASQEDLAHVGKMVEQLTDDDWDIELRKVVQKHDSKGKPGWAVLHPVRKDAEEGEDINGRTRVHDGACVFANRADGSTGKIGCAFVHMGQRKGLDHIDVMPQVCWQLPIVLDYDEYHEANMIRPWTREQWGGVNEEGNQDDWLLWWCVNSPDAYIGAKPFFITAERELRATMGDKAYEVMVHLLKQRAGNVLDPMEGSVGRKQIPLIVKNRTPRRVAPDFAKE